MLRAPLRRARLRQSGVQRAAGGIADISRVRPAPRRVVASGTRRSASTPASGPSADTANARRHDVVATKRGERRRGDRADHGERRLLEAERGAGPGHARPLRCGREREPVPAQAEHAGDDQRRARAPRAARRRARAATTMPATSAIPSKRSGHDARADAVRPVAGPDAGADAEDVRHREHGRRRLRRQPAMEVEEQHDEAHRRDLRGQVEATSRPPESTCRGRGGADARRRARQRAGSAARARARRRARRRRRSRRRARRTQASSRPRTRAPAASPPRARRRSARPSAGSRAPARAPPRRTSPSPRGRWRR